MQIIKLTLCLLALCAVSAHAEDPVASVKDGRQYTIDLARRLEVDQAELMSVFDGLKANAPRTHNIDEINGSMSTFARIANYACGYAADFTPETDDMNELYQRFFDRDATPAEVESAIRTESGTFAYYANCMNLALREDFLTSDKR